MEIPPRANVSKHVLLVTTGIQPESVLTIAVPIIEEPTTSPGIAKPHAPMALGDTISNANPFVPLVTMDTKLIETAMTLPADHP